MLFRPSDSVALPAVQDVVLRLLSHRLPQVQMAACALLEELVAEVSPWGGSPGPEGEPLEGKALEGSPGGEPWRGALGPALLEELVAEVSPWGGSPEP